MWLLGRLLQLLIYQWIPEQNEQWLSYLLLLDIVDIILAPSIDMEDTALLCAMVQDHHYDFVTIYPGVSVIPKMHSMIHMARLIQRFGLLQQHWTMRDESKHLYFKQLSNSLGNYINICHTLAVRHKQLHRFKQMEDLCSQEIEAGPGVSCLNLMDFHMKLKKCTE